MRTPIVLIVFNRPEQTERTFRRIAEVKPSHLLIIADGPRHHKAGEDELCAQVRRIVTAVDWPCEVKTNFSTENLGCRRRLISGLNWVFQQVEEAIILEDDILPDASFFIFCEQMLERFRLDLRIGMIAGFNIVQDHMQVEESYFFSHLTHIWGWATWRHSWSRYDEHLTEWPAIRSSGIMREFFPDNTHRQYWTKMFDQMYEGTGPNTWDVQWFYTNMKDYVLSVVPAVNLIENTGFGPNATHTLHLADAPPMRVGRIDFPLKHPPTFIPLRAMDALDQNLSRCEIPSLFRRVCNKLKRAILSPR